jgi:hypothetical protein
MRGLALCLVAGAIAIAGCGSSDNPSSSAPGQAKVTASAGISGASAAVSAKGRATPASLCTAEGNGKPKKQCVAALKKLDKGKAANPRSACKSLSKKKTKGVRGKSPYAVCVSAAAKLMASKAAAGNGAADSSSGNSDASDEDTSDSAGSSSSDEVDPICHDENGKVVPIDSDEVADCDIPDAPGASNSSNDSSDDSDSTGDETP